MSTTLAKRSWVAASHDAVQFKGLFPASTYERWEIAGSVRRNLKLVGDVEHVIIPRFAEVDAGGGGLFAERKTVNLVLHHLDQLVAGTIPLDDAERLTKHIYGAQGPRWGQKFRGVDFRGFNHELCMADADNWGKVLALKTGPAEFSQLLVTVIKKRGLLDRDGYVVRSADGQRVPVPEERDYFAACGVAYIEPEKRRGW